jgi:hypothetical protein
MNSGLNRRKVLLGAGAAAAFAATSQPGWSENELPEVNAFRNPGCGCCGNWAKLMEQAGFKITMTDDPDLAGRRKSLGVPEALGGCHFAQVGRYIIEGHVPVSDILRILDEQPDAMGLAVPGMPAGSPGMETEGQVEKYSVLIFKPDGSSEVYRQY